MLEKIMKILKERASGLLLLIFSALIIFVVLSNFYHTGSENKQNLTKDDQISSQEEILRKIGDNPPEAALTLDFIINSGSGTEKFPMEFKEGETVCELMEEAKTQGKITYEKNTDETYGVYINAINGLKEGSETDLANNKYWIFYVNGKSSSLGCSSHKLAKSDTSIEWRYEKYSF